MSSHRCLLFVADWSCIHDATGLRGLPRLMAEACLTLYETTFVSPVVRGGSDGEALDPARALRCLGFGLRPPAPSRIPGEHLRASGEVGGQIQIQR
jgi:hypothetical protein